MYVCNNKPYQLKTFIAFTIYMVFPYTLKFLQITYPVNGGI